MPRRFTPDTDHMEHVTVDLAGRSWDIARLSDLESLWEMIGEDEFGEDERLPYWAEIWPASMLLGTWLGEQKAAIAGRRCLDMGCGLGLTALVGSWLGARVTALDYEWPALFYARINGQANHEPHIGWVQMDWRMPGFKPQVFDYVWGGDIMYEKRFIEPVSRFLDRILTPGGLVCIAEPNRSVYTPFVEHMRSLGWSCDRHRTEKIRAVTTGTVPVTVNLWHLRRPEQ